MIMRLDRPRIADRSWIEEFDALSAQGFVWRFDRNDWEVGHSNVCVRCAEDMEFLRVERRRMPRLRPVRDVRLVGGVLTSHEPT